MANNKMTALEAERIKAPAYILPARCRQPRVIPENVIANSYRSACDALVAGGLLRFCARSLDHLPVGLCVFGVFENMRRDAAPLQRLAELDTQEA